MRKEEIRDIKNFFKAINEYRISECIIFGSRVRGDYLKSSDLDIIVISEDFAKVNFPQRANLFYGRWRKEPDIDFICYTPEEIRKKLRYKGLVSTALGEGIHLRIN